MNETVFSQQRNILFELFGIILVEYGTLSQKLYSMTNQIKALDMHIGEKYEKLFNQSKLRFQDIIEEFTQYYDFDSFYNTTDSQDLLSSKDKLLIILLSLNISNQQIAALLNTTPHNLKTRKSYLKKKILSQTEDSHTFKTILNILHH